MILFTQYIKMARMKRNCPDETPKQRPVNFAHKKGYMKEGAKNLTHKSMIPSIRLTIPVETNDMNKP